MENSIEEDIELLQDETSSLGLFFKCKGSEKYKIALEHILLDYKRVLKENKKIRNGRNRLFEYATAQQTTPEMLNKILREDYIPKDKIEEILDETEITDFNSLVEAFLEIKKLLESEE